MPVAFGCRTCFVGNAVGENRSQTISEGMLLQLTVADHDRTLTDGTGLSGSVHAGSKRIAVHFRYRYRNRGEPREMPLGAWPRDALADIRSAPITATTRCASAGCTPRPRATCISRTDMYRLQARPLWQHGNSGPLFVLDFVNNPAIPAGWTFSRVSTGTYYSAAGLLRELIEELSQLQTTIAGNTEYGLEKIESARDMVMGKKS